MQAWPQALEAYAQSQPAHTACSIYAGQKERSYSYTDLERDARAVAVALRRRGLGHGDHVATTCADGWEWLHALHSPKGAPPCTK
eukprot:1773112-Pleurochrysis_carterae.AAC.3